MVAVIKTGHSIHSIFNYNENKVKQGAAVCIGEGNYPIDVEKMNVTMKLNRFLKQLSLNENVTRNSVHISLNFDPSETGISKEKLMQIANSYMDKIDFGQQPYLVYQHHDSGHPHIHIVSIKVRADGSRIDMQNIGRNKSETARKEIEKSFGLVIAERGSKKDNLELLAVPAGTIQYGKMQTKKAIANVLNAVLLSYRYASLPELNAVLKQYNVYADRGSENSRIFKANGIVYRVLDSQGKPIGVPIKASDFYFKPTLKFLEEKFKTNKNKPILNSKRIKNLIDLAFLNKKTTLAELTKILEKQGINIVLRTSSENIIYGITYVDHTTKCVFNGSSLGKEYSVKAIEERCGLNVAGKEKRNQISEKFSSKEIFIENLQLQKDTLIIPDLVKALDILIQVEYRSDYIPNQLKNKIKKRRKTGLSNNL